MVDFSCLKIDWYKSKDTSLTIKNSAKKGAFCSHLKQLLARYPRYFAPDSGPRPGGTSQTSRLETIIFIGMGFDLYRPAALHCMGGAGGTAPGGT